MAKVRLNRAGVRELLHAPGVVADLTWRAVAVQAAFAGPTDITTRVLPSGRAIVTVTDNRVDALWRESWTGDLAQALNAAGGTREAVGNKWGPKRHWGPGLRFPRGGAA